MLRWIRRWPWLRAWANPEHQYLLLAMDVLDEHSDKLHMRLAKLMRPLVDQDLAVVLYDFITVQVTGQSDIQDDVRKYGVVKSGLMIASSCLL